MKNKRIVIIFLWIAFILFSCNRVNTNTDFIILDFENKTLKVYNENYVVKAIYVTAENKYLYSLTLNDFETGLDSLNLLYPTKKYDIEYQVNELSNSDFLSFSVYLMNKKPPQNMFGIKFDSSSKELKIIDTIFFNGKRRDFFDKI